ncbi:MAG: hypothetical protein ACQ9MH_22505 [Nitrospinales bacterium]
MKQKSGISMDIISGSATKCRGVDQFGDLKMSKYEGGLTVLWRNIFLTWHPGMMLSVVLLGWR